MVYLMTLYMMMLLLKHFYKLEKMYLIFYIINKYYLLNGRKNTNFHKD